VSRIVRPLITLLNFEPQSLWISTGQAIALARRLHSVGVATDIKNAVRRRRKVRDCTGRIQFQVSIELQSCFSFTLTREFHGRASRRRATYHMLATPSAASRF
jgi:hypothetical protein